jgi:protein ImuB
MEQQAFSTWNGIMVAALSLSPSPLTRRYLFLALPYLATDRIHRRALGRSWRSVAPPEAPLVVVAKVKNALRLSALDERGERLGLARGQTLADARAMIPAIETVAEDNVADRALLEDLADWAGRYTPLVALDADNGLILDITGAAHLFGGEEALLSDLSARLAGQGFLARAAIADTPGAAAAAARFGFPSVVPTGGAARMLRPLPLAALRLDRETVAAMDRVGLKRIGQIADLPRAPLAARFGTMLIRRLDQTLGREEETIAPRRPVAPLSAERRFAEPIAREEDVSATLSSLATTLAASLEAQGLGARELELALFRVDGFVARTVVATSRPVRAPKLVLDLFREKFAGLGETFDAGFGFDVIRLSVNVAAVQSPVQVDLAGDAVAEADLGQLIDRIGARLGSARVGRIVTEDNHIPEGAERFAIAGEHDSRDNSSALPSFDPDAAIDRPLRLFARPEPVEAIAEVPDGPPVRFRWRRTLYRVARAEGPERIAAEWWRNDDLTRDYFRVEDVSGHRFWLFREGLYGREDLAPRWYLHGVFA